jgi:PAS domain S-box-containing protein
MSLATAFAPRFPRPWTRHAVSWGGGLFIGVIVAMAAYDIVRGYRDTISTTGRELDTHARVIAEQTARSLQAVDVVLRHVAEQSRRGTLEALNDQDLHAYLKEQAVGLVQSAGLAVLHPTGAWRATSAMFPLPAPVPDSSAMALFQVHRGTCCDVGLYVGEANRGQLDGVWVFPITRRLESPSGAFAGIVGARGRVDYFQDFYRDIRLGAGTTIALVHQGGSLLAHDPAVESALGQRYPLFDQMLAARAAAPEDPTRTVNPIDGVERFGAIQVVPDYPLAVIVTRDASVALAPWRAQAIGTGVRTIALSALAVVFLAIAMRRLARLHDARASLEISQERYALAVAGSNDGIWDHDLIARRAFVSARARELSGMPPGPETLALDEWFAMLEQSIHPDDVPRRAAALQAHLLGQTPMYECDIRHRGPDGVYRWVRLHGLCLHDATGKPYRMAGSVSDIDVRKRAEEALRASEERFALAVAGSNDGIWDFDFAAQRVFNSARARELAGMPPGPAMQSIDAWQALIAQHLHPDDAPRRAAAMQAHLAGQTPAFECEVRMRHPDGEYRWVHIHGLCLRDDTGKPYRMAGSVSDFDARKRAEEALRLSEERYQLAVNGANQGLWDWNLVNDTLFLSPRAQELMGIASPIQVSLPRREWIARTPNHPDDVDALRAAISAHLHGATEYFVAEYRIRHPSGDWHWYRQRGVALRDEHGRPYRMAGSMEDITEAKNAEAERGRLEGQLLQAKKLEAIGTLAGGIAHDFNNILAAILGNGELAQMDAPEGTPLRRHIDAAVSAGMRAKSLVERILAFSRSGIGERVPVHVRSVVAEALDLVAAALPAHVQLDRQLAIDNAAVMGDPTQIHQVLMNLCTNAVQAMKSQGTLTVRLDLDERSDSIVATGALPGGTFIRLSVRDTGAGIPPNVLDRICDPFFTTKEIGVGTGLGLSLVHGIVTDLGGGIDVESRVGEGTTFTIYLPASGSAIAAGPVEELITTGDGETILLVDDEEALVQMGEELIAKLGYEPVGFTSSTAALQEFRAAPDRFRAVLSDESMPDMTGSELAEAIRTIRPDVPIVLMSGFVSQALAARARELGVADVLAKPLVARDIARSLAGALRDH